MWRAGLLIKSQIQGKMFKMIFSLHDKTKSCVKLGHTFSDCFTCDIGVRQGVILFPFLFATYLNELEEFLSEHCKTGIDSLDTLSFENLDVYMKLFLLLYTDDTNF